MNDGILNCLLPIDDCWAEAARDDKVYVSLFNSNHFILIKLISKDRRDF